MHIRKRSIRRLPSVKKIHEEMTSTIYRVPWCLKGKGGNNNDAFKPRIVSIGPYYNGEAHLEGMQFHKCRVVQCILRRTAKTFEFLIDTLRGLIVEAKACYEDLPELDDEAFLHMLVLDGCFLLEFIVGRYEKDYRKLGYDEVDPIFFRPYMFRGIETDMILLQNQIPLKILNKLCKAIYNEHMGIDEDTIIKRVLERFNSSLVIGRLPETFDFKKNDLVYKFRSQRDKLSCLRIFWEELMCTNENTTITIEDKDEEMLDLQQNIIPSVTAMKEAGVQFMHKTTIPFWGVEFKGRVMTMPQIMITADFEPLFLNLMAFELRHVSILTDCKITSYVLLLDSLVNSATDVAALRDTGIIVSAGLNDEEIADLINHIGRQVFIPFNQFNKMSKEIHSYCKKNRNRWQAILIRNYFNNPWTITSIIVAAVLLLLTILQSCYTVLQYYNKS